MYEKFTDHARKVMYQRFTDNAREIMQAANKEALRLRHEYIGTEHILLGLIAEQTSVAVMVLKNLDVNIDGLRKAIERLLQPGPVPTRAALYPKTPRAKMVIEYAIEESRMMQHGFVGSEHLLLGLLREQEGIAAQVLMNEGLTLDDTRDEITGLLKFGIRTPTSAAAKSRLVQQPIEDLPEELHEVAARLDAEMKRATAAKEEAIAAQRFEEAAEMRDQAHKAMLERKRLIHEWAVYYPTEMSWLTHNNSAVLSLAHEISRFRAWESLPLLADALEQAGCDDARLLEHCRQGGPHAEQCWVVDLLLASVEPPDRP